jgi:hypothetical protein
MTARQYGTIGIVGVTGWVLANLLLHVLDPGLSVMNTTTSEYALGDYGWLKRAAEFSNAVGLVAIALGLRATLAPGKRVTASWVLMLVIGISFFLDVVFVTDAMGSDEVTLSGGIHLLSFLVAIISLTTVVWMLRGVFARDDRWRHFQRAQHWFAVVFSVVVVGNIALVETAPGLAQRVMIVVTASWWLALAVNIRRVSEARSDREPTVPAAN